MTTVERRLDGRARVFLWATWQCRKPLLAAVAVVSACVSVPLWFATLATLGSPQPFWPWPAMNYLALIVFSSLSTGLLASRWFGRRVSTLIAAGITLVALVCLGAVDTYTREWTTVWDDEQLEFVVLPGGLAFGDESHKGPWNVYRDTHKRWSGRITYRVLTMCTGTSFKERLTPDSFEGPLSPSGKPHGHWVQTTWSPYQRTDEWYWYGEKITEGEWHLRNK